MDQLEISENNQHDSNSELPVEHAISWRIVAFVVFHVAVLGAGIGWGAYRIRQMDAEKILPRPSNEPLKVLPTYNVPEVVSDEQLPRVLAKLQPRFRGPNPKINFIDHALRMWGTDAQFADEEVLSGSDLREILLDYRRFNEAWSEKTQDLLMEGNAGVRVRTQEGDATASHHDHTLASLAEVGTPLDFPVMTKIGEARVLSLLRQSLRDFSLNQVEYEWSSLAYALYLPTPGSWYTSEGQLINFDRLADRMMRQALPQGVCLGNHRMHALVMLLRVDDQKRIISTEMRKRIIAFLKDVTDRLVAAQHADGYWDRSWAGTLPPGADSPTDVISHRILATGHPMEWWALAPEEVHPPLETLVFAGQWLCKTIDEMSPREIEVNFTFLSHAGRALALWRGKLPAQVELPAPVELPNN